MQTGEANQNQELEGRDGKNVTYRERLLPGPFAWILVLLMTISLGIAYGDVYGFGFGVLLATFGTAAIYLVMFFTSPIVQIDELVLRVGGARLPRKFVAEPKILNREQTTNSKRIALPKNAYLVLRAAIPESVLVQVSDESDPHPYWQFSSRNPEKLISALTSKS